MLTHSLRRLPDIEAILGDFTVFSDRCIVMLMTVSIPPETPDNTIHWPNADVMQGQVYDAEPTLFKPKPFKL